MTKPNQRQSNLYQSLVLNSGDPMYLSDYSGKLIEVNEQACLNLGYSREELLSLTIGDIDVCYKNEEQLKEVFHRLEKEKYVKLSTTHQRKDGSKYPAELSISLLIENDQKLILGIARDVSKHLAIEQSLDVYINTIEKIHLIIKNSPEIKIIIHDVLVLIKNVFKADRCFLFPISQGESLFELPSVEIVSQDVSEISDLGGNAALENYRDLLLQKINSEKKNQILHTESVHDIDTLSLFQIKSEMIIVENIEENMSFLLGLHTTRKQVEWTELEQKLLIDISRRLEDTIKRLLYNHRLKESEKKYRTLYNKAPIPYHSLDTNGEIIDVNDTWLNFLGYERKEVIGKNYEYFLHPQWKKTFHDNFPNFKKRGYVNNVEFKIRHKKGHYKYISLEGVTNSHTNGTFKQTYCVFQDISARKKAEIKLKESEERYRLLMEQSPFVVEVYDLNGLQISVNKAYEELWQIPAKLSLFKYNILTSPKVRSSGLLNYIKRAYAGETIDLPDHEYKPESDMNGKYKSRSRWLRSRLYPLKNEFGKVTNIVVVHRDISNQKKAEAKFEESEAKFKNFVQKAPIPLSNVDNTTGEVKYINNRFLEIFGYTHGEISTMEKWWNLAYPDPDYRKFAIDKWQKAVELASINKTDIIPEVYNITCKNGNVKQILVSGITIGNEFFAMLVDISTQKKIEQELITAKNKAEESEKLKTAFLANMSHEIRTPMNGILGFAELLQTPNLSEEKNQKYIHIIMQSGNKMLSTINDIIEISKIETQQIYPEPQKVNITEILDSQYAFFLPEVNKNRIAFTLKNSLSESESQIVSDFSMLDSILTNLIKNAIKYTNKGSIEFGCAKKEQSIEFYVKDTGIGISPDQQKIIFERFRQVHNDNTKTIEGSGLGLSIAKAYTELLGGKIWMKSKKDVGSQFFFTLPIKN